MRQIHIRHVSKRTPGCACGGYNDGSVMGWILWRKCQKGKISGVGGMGA